MVDRATIERAVTWVLVVALVASTAGVVYVAANPPPASEPYTEFYVLGPDGNASEYPTNLTVGETGTVIVGVSNHEHQDETYTVVMELENETVSEQQVQVNDGETRENELSFTAEEAGRQKLRLLLYKNGAESPYRTLRLWLNVSS
jgi:uncharacterized membrane protein